MTRTPGNKKWLQNIAKKINLPLYPKKIFNGEEVTLMPDGTVRLSETGEKPSAEALEAYQDFVKKFNERLRRFGVRTIDGKATLNTVSRFSDDYYKKYASTPLLKQVSPNNDFPFHLQLQEDYIIQINYSQETDYELISKQLNQLDMDILLFIATFRNVQLLQISREFGLPIPKIKPHLKRLREFYLVQEWEFEREDTPGALATSYSIYSHGTMLLLLANKISRNFTYKWKDILREEDNYSPIRYWKVVDAYQNFKFNQNYAYFVPTSKLEKFTYTLTKTQEKSEGTSPLSGMEKRKSELQAKKAKKKERTYTVHVPRYLFIGQLALNKKADDGTKNLFDVYPYITNVGDTSDLDKLLNVFKHFGRFEDGLDEEGNKRYLLIIVDNFDDIQEIEDKYMLIENGGYKNLNNIIFLNLELAAEEGIDKSLVVIRSQNTTEGGRVAKYMPFRMNEAFNERPLIKDAELEELEQEEGDTDA